MLQKEQHVLSVDDLFEDNRIGDFVKSIQIDSPYQQLLFEGVLTESVKEEKLYVSFTVEGYFHYVLGEVIFNLTHLTDIYKLVKLANESNLVGVKEGIQYYLINDISKGNTARLFSLIDESTFPLEICIRPLSFYFLKKQIEYSDGIEKKHNSIHFLEVLLSQPTKRDFEILRSVLKYLKNVDFNLVIKIYDQILRVEKKNEDNEFKLLLSEALSFLPVEKINDTDLNYFVSGDPEIQFELNIDKIRFQRKKNQHSMAQRFINDNVKVLEDQHVDINLKVISIFYDALSFYHTDCGEYEFAKIASKKALSYLDETDSGYGISLNNLALIYIDLNDYEMAQNYLAQAYELDSNLFGKYSENCASRLGNFGYLYQLMGEYEKSLSYLNQALEIDQKIFGYNHENVATRLLNISDCLRNLNRIDDALVALHKSRQIDIYNYGNEHPILAASYNIESHIFLEQKNYENAHHSLNRAISINEKLNGGINDQLNRDYNFQGILYSKEGQFEKALESFIFADKIEEILFFDLPQNRIITWINICKTLKNIGNFNTSNLYYHRILSLSDKVKENYSKLIDDLIK
jgi:tetratricopeptide (TPR) repeat protein